MGSSRQPHGFAIGFAFRLPLNAALRLFAQRYKGMASPIRFLRRVLGRSVAVLLLVAAALGGYAFRLCQQDGPDYRQRQEARIAVLVAQRDALQGSVTAVAARRTDNAAALTAEETRTRQAEKVIASLRALESTWDRLVGNPAQQQANAEQIRRMEEMRDTARSKAAAIKQELSRLTWEKDGLEIDLGRLAGEIRREENDRSPTWHYLSLAGKKSRGWLALLAVL